MCKVFNTVGALNDIESHLINHNINEFTSLDELITFQKQYHSRQQEIILDHTLLVEQEKIFLEKDIDEFNEVISIRKLELKKELQQQLDNFDQELCNLPIADFKIIPIIKDYYMCLIIWAKIRYSQIIYYFKYFILTRKSDKLISTKNKQLNYIVTNFNEAARQSGSSQLQTLLRKKTIIDEINNSIYGAIGEQKVANVLANLSDDYILINDFKYSFHPPLYYHKKNDRIKSIQIDHLLISPSGIFIIETKNWSEQSIANPYLRSPAEQVNRTNFALFKILADKKANSNFNFSNYNWVNKKIPIRNLIVFINNKPKEEFDFVKILSPTDLLSYIKYFTPSFTSNETQMIANYLLQISEKNNRCSKLII